MEAGGWVGGSWSQEVLPETGLGGLAKWGQRAYGSGCAAEGGVPLAAAPYLTSAHAHSCGVVPKADAAPC